MDFRLHDVHVVTPEEIVHQDMLVVDGRIADFVPLDATHASDLTFVDAKGAIAYPGMIDLLTHGYGDHLYTDLEPEAVGNNSRELPKHGVTGFCPSIVTHGLEDLMRILSVLSDSLESPGARAIGIHSEGPCLASAGAHKKDALANPSAELARRMSEAAYGQLRLVTLAPELPGAEAFCQVLNEVGVGVHLGHSCAPPEDVPQYVDWGVTGVTHIYDVMVPAMVTEPGVYPLSLADALLAQEELCLGLICDGVHAHPRQVKLLSQLPPERLFLETDSMKFTGLAPGRFELYPGAWVNTSEDNAARGDTGGLVGSCLTSDRALRNLIAFTGMSLSQASIATSLNPARLLRLEYELGSLEVGKMADVTLLHPDNLGVIATYVAGEQVYIAG